MGKLAILLVVLVAACIWGANWLEKHAPERAVSDGTAQASVAQAVEAPHPLSAHLVVNTPVQDKSVAQTRRDIQTLQQRCMARFLETRDPRDIMEMPPEIQAYAARVDDITNTTPIYEYRTLPERLLKEETYITREEYPQAKEAYQLLTTGTPTILVRVQLLETEFRHRQAAFASIREPLFQAVLDQKVSQHAHDLWTIVTDDARLREAVRDPTIVSVSNQVSKANRLVETFRTKLLEQKLTTVDLEKMRLAYNWSVFALEELGRVHDTLDELLTEFRTCKDVDFLKSVASYPVNDYSGEYNENEFPYRNLSHRRPVRDRIAPDTLYFVNDFERHPAKCVGFARCNPLNPNVTEGDATRPPYAVYPKFKPANQRGW
jgi:hypothetical protein